MLKNFSTDRRQSLGPSAFSSIAGSHPGSGGTVKYSDLMGTVASRAKGTMFSRGKKDKGRSEDIFTVRDSGGTQRSLGPGLRSGHQADIVFRDKEVSMGDTEDREEERESDTYLVEPSSIFNRSTINIIESIFPQNSIIIQTWVWQRCFQTFNISIQCIISER